MNVILCGMPGSGKSHLGKKAAQELNCHFIDTDRIIEQRGHTSCAEIVLKNGESYFRELERRVICELEGVQNTVIALGGGALSSKEIIYFLRKLGILIYLIVPLSALKKPLPSFLKDRTYEEVFEERHLIYKQACHLSGDRENVFKMMRRIYGK